MTMIKSVFASTLLLLSGTALADIKVVDSQNGAWVSVSHNGSPIQGAQVSVKNVPQQRETYITDKSGRAFIPLTLESSRSVKYQVLKPGSDKVESRYAFHTSNK